MNAHFNQDPYFTNIDFNEDSAFAATVTDSGLCHVMNGPPIGNVFAPSERIGQLEAAFDLGLGLGLGRVANFTPAKIEGTGYIHQKSFWVDVGTRGVMSSCDRSSRIILPKFQSNQCQNKIWSAKVLK